MDMVHKNAKTLEEYIEQTNECQKENFTEKLEELGEILAAQLRQEDALIRESTRRKGKLKTAPNIRGALIFAFLCLRCNLKLNRWQHQAR